MKTRKILVVVLAVVVSAIVAWANQAPAAQEEATKEARQDADEAGSFWMQKKLEYTEKILAGLAKEDYQQIARNARSMRALNQMERWVRAGMPEYRTQLRIFENANDQLIRLADEEKLDGAALAYVQLTLSCVNCHKVIRHGASERQPQAK